MSSVFLVIALAIIFVLLWTYRVYVIVAFVVGVAIFVARKLITNKKPRSEPTVHSSESTVVEPCYMHPDIITTAESSLSPSIHAPGHRPAVDFQKRALRMNHKGDARKLTKYIVIDFETTGLSADEDDIIEVGAIKVIDGEISETLCSFVNPGYAIPRRITALTGITTKDIQGAPSPAAIALQVRDFISDLPLIAHNASFDLKFLEAAYRQAGISASISYVDTLALARRAFPGMENHKLSTLIKCLNLSTDEQSHRAIDDVLCTHKLLCACIEALPDKPVKTRQQTNPTECAESL